MNFTQFDSYSGLFHFPTESPLCDFQETGTFFSECQIADRVGDGVCDNVWLNDDKMISMYSRPTAPPPIRQCESLYPERSSLLSVRKRKSSDLSESLVTKTNHFIYKDDFLWSDSKELPDVILVSPRRESTPDANVNPFFNDDDKASLNFDFDNALKNVQVEVGLDYSVDLNTKEDVEYLDNLLAGFSDQPVQNFDHDFASVRIKNELVPSDPSSFNEISCNIHQQGVVTDSKSAIKTLLEHESFKGNFCMKKSTEILSEIDQSHDCFAEHNYFSATKIPKPRVKTIRNGAAECSVPDVPSATYVPIHSQDFVVETEVSSTPSSPLHLKTPKIVLDQCAAAKTSSSSKPAKSKSREVTKPAKKPASSKTDPDPTYEPNSKRKRPAKKGQTPKTKLNATPPKAISLVPKFNTCSIAQLPRIPLKPTGDAEAKPCQRDNLVKARVPAIETSKMAPRMSATSPFITAVPETLSNPPTPLASPTRDDMEHDEFTIQDSCQPETLHSNVDAVVEPIKPAEESAPKIDKKKISLQEYLQKRATSIKSEPEGTNGTVDESESIESIAVSPPLNVEEILKTIVKPEPLRIDDVLKTIIKKEPIRSEQKPKPVIKTEPVSTEKVPKPVVKSEPISRDIVPKPVVKREPLTAVVKSQPIPKPAKVPKKESIRQREPNTNKPMNKPRRDQKPIQETDNSVPLKLIKLAIPDKASSVRSYSSSPNEISQSIDSCDRYSSSGFSSYHNSSVSSTCGSPFNAHDDKSNDTKYSDSERIATIGKRQQTEKKMPEIPFAVNKDLLRKDDRSSRKRKHRREKSRRSDSGSRKRKLSDSCFEDDSDCSDYSDRKRSRKRYSSTSSSSSEKSHHRSYNEYSLSPRTFHEFRDWKYSQQDMPPESYYYNYSEMPNMFYPPPPAGVWHPQFAYYPAFAPSLELPLFYNGSSHEPVHDTGDVEIEKRALFVGNIEDGLSEKEFYNKFKKFGSIERIKLHFRDPQSNYGFVYYTDEKYVRKAINQGSEDPNLSHYKLGVGIRKERCVDRRALAYEKTIPVTNLQTPCYREHEDSYNAKLEQLKNDLKQNKLNGRYQ